MARWLRRPSDPQAEARLVKELGLTRVHARLLCARALDDPDRARAFLNPSLEQFRDPMLPARLPDAASNAWMRASSSPASKSFVAAMAAEMRTRARATEFSSPSASTVAISRIRRMASTLPSPVKS